MSIFNVVQLLGGLAFFLFAMTIMSNGLQRLAGGKLEKMLRKATAKPLMALGLGAFITAAIQSSSSVTVMLVGLVNSGIMQLEQAVPVIFGCEIGTTITSWILSLTGIDADNSILLQFLKPKNFAPLFALIGVILAMVGKTQKRKDAGSILTGFGILMYGMVMMSSAMEPLAEMPSFTSILARFNNPVLGVATGMLFTALIQSSAATLGILQALSLSSTISLGQLVPVIMGLNIGTCITAVLSSIGTTKNAKRVACVHVGFNTVGTIIWLTVWLVATTFFIPWAKAIEVNPLTVAIVHTIFNGGNIILLFGFRNLLCKLSRLIIRDGSKSETALDEHLFTMPAFAVRRAFETTSKMGRVAKRSVNAAIGILESGSFTDEAGAKVDGYEDRLDHYEDDLGTYLLKVSKLELSEKDVKNTSLMMHGITNFERIGDHAVDLMHSAKELHDKELALPEKTAAELKVLYAAVSDLVDKTVESFQQDDLRMAKTIEPLEDRVDKLSYKIKAHQIDALREGDTTAEMGFILSDILTALERIGDHCSNIAATMIESEEGEYDQHAYLQNTKEDADFKRMYQEYKAQYNLDNI